jgi:hypothetical protein
MTAAKDDRDPTREKEENAASVPGKEGDGGVAVLPFRRPKAVAFHVRRQWR